MIQQNDCTVIRELTARCVFFFESVYVIQKLLFLSFMCGKPSSKLANLKVHNATTISDYTQREKSVSGLRPRRSNSTFNKNP